MTPPIWPDEQGRPLPSGVISRGLVLTGLLLAGCAPPPPQIPYGAPISLEQAKKVLAGAEAEARKNQWNMVIAVLDSGGHLVMLARMDGTQLGSIEAAKDKAYSAGLYRRPTKVFQDLVGQGGANLRIAETERSQPARGRDSDPGGREDRRRGRRVWRRLRAGCAGRQGWRGRVDKVSTRVAGQPRGAGPPCVLPCASTLSGPRRGAAYA